MPHNNCTDENASMGVASIQSALDILNDSGKLHFLDNINSWDCSMDNQMFGLIGYSLVYCKMD